LTLAVGPGLEAAQGEAAAGVGDVGVHAAQRQAGAAAGAVELDHRQHLRLGHRLAARGHDDPGDGAVHVEGDHQARALGLASQVEQERRRRRRFGPPAETWV